MRTILGIIVTTTLPIVCHANLSFSEVAWMGSTLSANYEWIELYNSGEVVSVDGWQITDGRNLSITLEGTIAANSYAVLERTSDESAPGSAFFIYTGAMVNTGSTLTLTRPDGSVVDQIVGGENWEEIGGDNITKETAQYTEGGWVTGAPTPAKANITVGSVPIEDTSTENQTSTSDTLTVPTRKTSSKSSAGETVRLELANATLALAIDAQRVAYVNQAIDFTAVASGIGKTPLNSLDYEWNFGDAGTARGASRVHAYQFPGTYVVTLHAEFSRHEQVARHEVTVLPVALTVDKSNDGTVYLHNTAPYELDISGFVVVGQRRFTFPPRSIVLPQQTITLPVTRTGASHVPTVVVHDTEGVVVGRSGESVNQLTAVSVATVPPTPPPLLVATTPPSSAFTFATTESLPVMAATTTSATELELATTTATTAQLVAMPPTISSATTSRPRSPLSDPNLVPYLGLIVLLGTALVAVWLLRPPTA